MTQTNTEDVVYDPTSPEVMANPAPAHAALRARCPVHRFDGLGRPLYTVARQEDVHAIVSDAVTWSNRYGPGIGHAESSLGDMQKEDSPEHERRRQFVRQAFLPQAVKKLRPRLEEVAGGLIDQFEMEGRCDLHDTFALVLPVTVFAELMGLPLDDLDEVKEWAETLTVGMAFPERGEIARLAFSRYVRDQVAKRRADSDPPAGLLTDVAVTPYFDDGGLLPVDELTGMITQLLVAGHETTTSLLTNLVWRLLERRDRWETVRGQPELIPVAIEESLRYDPPVLGLCRTNNGDVNLHGIAIPADSKVMILFASANRDPALFNDPDQFRLDRPLGQVRHHYGFGWGAHFCLGAHLARLTADVALRALVDRLPGLRLDGPVERNASPFLWGRRHLPVAW